MTYKKKLIEVALPLEAISDAAAHEKSIRLGHPSNLHQWFARRPLAAARAVLLAQLIDDPSSRTDLFPSEESQKFERARIFDLIEHLVQWDNSNDPHLIEEARSLIKRSGDGVIPSVIDPFSGGGTIPLEALRLGLEVHARDLNPVPTLITRALVEIPQVLRTLGPVNPSTNTTLVQDELGGLADDIRHYGEWIRQQAIQRIGHLYSSSLGESNESVVAWIWARTVPSPDPSWDATVPLVRSWLLRKAKRGKPALWLEPKVDYSSNSISYVVREGGSEPAGTYSHGRGRCIATGALIDDTYIKNAAANGKMGVVLLAVASTGDRGRTYSTPAQNPILETGVPDPTNGGVLLSTHPQYMSPPRFGLTHSSDLFTPRQLAAMSTFCELVVEVWDVILSDAVHTGLPLTGQRLREGGDGAEAYADAVVTYLALAVGKLADLNNSLVLWKSDAECPVHLFGRQAYPMPMDFAESNPLGLASGSWKVMVDGIIRAFKSKAWPLKVLSAVGNVEQGDARAPFPSGSLLCTDPPYYAAVPYADLGDFFIPWLRVMLKDVWPAETSTIASPKEQELVADVQRWGSKAEANRIFEEGMTNVFRNALAAAPDDYPIAVFYALKQIDTKAETPSGWEAFLTALIDAGWQITATWPIKTETRHRLRAQGSAALASSVVVAARKREPGSPIGTPTELTQQLRAVLPGAIRVLQQQSIAAVDLAQAAVGPGMAVFCAYDRVIDASGRDMNVREAIETINRVIEEIVSSEQTDFDSATRWAVTWFDQVGYGQGDFGDADVLARAKGTAVAQMVSNGMVISRDGKIRLVSREEMSDLWQSTSDREPTVWLTTQALVKRLEQGELAAADLLRKVGPGYGERTRQLAYRLYVIADRKGWAKEAVGYNGLIVAWPELVRLASLDSGPTQSTLGEGF